VPGAFRPRVEAYCRAVATARPPIDLTQPRDVGGILGGAFRLYRRRFWLFAAIAFSVVLPLDLLVYGVAGELLWNNDDFADSLPTGAAVAAAVTPWVVMTPLITAGHVRAVMELAEGRDPSARSALAAALPILPAVIAAVVLAAIGSFLGLVLLIVGAIYLWVRWAVSAQAVAAEELGPVEGMSRSWNLVEDNWWRVFGIFILITIIGGLMAAVAGLPFMAAGALADSGPLTLIGQILLDGVVYSFTALAGTLLYFDLRARHEGAPPPPQQRYPQLPPRDWDAPERP
jgi:hypothetical protein